MPNRSKKCKSMFQGREHIKSRLGLNLTMQIGEDAIWSFEERQFVSRRSKTLEQWRELEIERDIYNIAEKVFREQGRWAAYALWGRDKTEVVWK